MIMKSGYIQRVGVTKINKWLFEFPKVNTKTIQLKPKYKVMFRILIEHVVPKGDPMDHINKDH